MENKNSKIGITAFLILILSTTEMHPVLKYIMLFVATISFIITMVQLYEENKSTRLSSKAKK
ncbi:hypothetical protein FA048_19240 [Pedobacter polaris]|uniref:Uncharacterized protein n=1 Tax=Pedobacter polaris TaxID=2571273 RepID=A0A4U1CHD2_9SPHI|nr:hypothetical protein [Pedobacter polaris]TKC04599.1 hypothetical protein FA048_19240 [Pedobacter polaris]